MTKKSPAFKTNLSIVVTNFNGKKFIGDCINSILQSSYKNFEIVIIDDVSKDGSLSFLRNIYKNIKKIRMFGLKNRHYFTGSNNYGANKSCGEYIFFLNSDTFLDPSCLKKLMEQLQKHRNDLLQPKILKYFKKKEIDSLGGVYDFFGFGRSIQKESRNNNLPQRTILPIDYANGTAFMLRRSLFLKLGGLDERLKYYYEDVDFSLRLRKNGGKIWCVKDAIIYHKGSLSINKNINWLALKIEILKNRLLILLKHKEKVLLPFVIPIHFFLTFFYIISEFIQKRLVKRPFSQN